MGIFVVILVITLVVKYIRNDRGNIPQELLNQNSTENVEKHKVAEGENLWQIAEERYGDGNKWVDIATENKLENASIVETGQELVIPDLEAEKVTVAEADEENPSDDSEYTVAKGDSLWNIAVKEYGDGYKWVEIARENKLTNPNIIHAGNVLVLPK